MLWILVAGCSTDATNSPGVTPDRTGTVAGRVFDLVSGKEIPGAFVSLESGRGSVQTISDLDGQFLFRDVQSGTYRLSADAGGFRGHFQSVILEPRVHLGVDLGMRPAVVTGDLTGLVVDVASGASIGSAVLSIPAKAVTTFTDSGGRFTVRGLDAGGLTVEVRAVGYAPYSARVTVPAGGAELQTFRLVANAGSIRGTVTSTSTVFGTRLLFGALVKLLEPISPGAIRRIPPGHSVTFQAQSTGVISLAETGVQTRSGADGTYRLDNVTAGTVGVLFSCDSHDDLLATTAVLLGRTAIVNAPMRFNRTTVAGRVVDVNNQPVAGAVVSVPEQGLTTRTDSNGQYQFFQLVIAKDFPRLVLINGFPVALPAHQTPIGVLASGFAPNSALAQLVAGGTVTLDFVLGRSTGTLTGLAKKARDGTTVPGAVVSLPQLGLTTPVDFSGNFAFVDLPAAQLAVSVNAVGFLPATTFVVVLPGQPASTQILLAAPGALNGTVRKQTGGSPISGARVVLPELARQTSTDAAGGFNFNDLPTRTLRVEFSAVGATSLSTSTVITDGAVTQLNVALGP